MYQPVRRADVGARLAPLPRNTLPRLPVAVKGAVYKNKNPVFKPLPHQPRHRQLSSLQSHRSRVFARRSALPSILRTDPLNQRPHQRTAAAGRGTESGLPRVFLTTDHQDITTAANAQQTTKHDGGHVAKVAVGVAGMSSKEAGSHHLKSDRMAMGWAQVRAAQTIPNLRDSQDMENEAKQTGTTEAEVKRPTIKTHESPNDSNTPSRSKAKGQVISNTTPRKPNHRKQAGGHHSKLSSGYGSMTSESPRVEEAPRHPIFRPGDSHSDPGLTKVSQKKRLMEGIYGNVVRVEEGQTKGRSRRNKDYVLTEREAQVYRDLATAYRDTAERDKQKRKELFFKKLQDVQIVSALIHNQELSEQASRRQQARRRQQQQLNHIRNKFEEERTKRFKTQYVTKNFESYEKMDRVEYGLPEVHMEKKNSHVAVRRPAGEKITPLAFVKRQVKLKKSYSKMFTDPQTGKRVKSPKMEGVDQVTVEVQDSEGATKKSKLDVKTELQQATQVIQELNASEDAVDSSLNTEPSPSRLHAKAKGAPSKPCGDAQTNHTPSSKYTNQKASQNSKTESKRVVSKPPIHSNSKQTITDNTVSRTSKHTTERQPKSNQNVTQPTDLRLLTDKVVPSTTSRSRLGVTAHADTVSMTSKISVITEESEEDEDFYDKLMAKYGIELSDDEDDVI